MEDLDLERSRTIYADAALEDLRWLGITWQEGPDVGGSLGPYLQSERLELYRTAWRKLLDRGFLYPCRCSRKDLAAASSAPHEGADLDDEPIYPGTCRALPLRGAGFWTSVEAEREEKSVNWRFRAPEGEVVEFVDGNLGPQRFVAGKDFGDFIVWRRDGVPRSPRKGSRPWAGGAPSYQLACVVDDAAMQITEIVRGADLLKSTARQILLNRALGYADPAWFHCSLITDASGKRLAKRHDALSILALRKRGWTPDEILRPEAISEY